MEREFTAVELQKKRRESLKKMRDYLDRAEAEKRNLTEEEQQEYNTLEADVNEIDRSLRYAQLAGEREKYAIINYRHELAEQVRALIRGEVKHVEIDLRTALRAMTTSDVVSLTSTHVKGIIEPLEKGMIMGLLGIKMPKNMSFSEKWSIIGATEASLADEAVAIDAGEIPLTALTPSPKRAAIRISVSNAAVDASDGKLINEIVMPQIIASLQRLLNKWMFSTSAIATGVGGCMVNPLNTRTFAGAVPTYAELMALKGRVRAHGVIDDGTFAWVMSSEMAAALAATPKDTGSGRFIIEDNKIDQVPVFETQYIETANTDLATAGPLYVGFGRFSDWMCGQFGNPRLTVDPYSGAAADITYLTLNTWFAQNALRAESFGLGTATLS